MASSATMQHAAATQKNAVRSVIRPAGARGACTDEVNAGCMARRKVYLGESRFNRLARAALVPAVA